MSTPTAVPSSTPHIIRNLGSLESYQTALYALDFYCGTSITCRYGIPDTLRNATHSELMDFMELAVADTVLQHPLLQVGLIHESSTCPAWVQLDHIDLSQHIEWKIVDSSERYNNILKGIVEEQVDTKFSSPASRPSWRVVVLRNGGHHALDVMFVWHHSHSDGTGAKIFHSTLLQSLNNLKEGSHQPLKNHLLKTTSTAQNLPPPQDIVAPYSISPKFALSVVWKEIIPLKLSSRLYPHTSWGAIRTTACKTQLRRLNIDNATLQKVLSACRTHNTTLTGLLHGITFVSLAPQLPEKQVAAMIGETALNLRRLMAPNPPVYPTLEPTKTIANYVGIMEHKFDKALVSRIRGLGRQSLNLSADSEMRVALEDEIWRTSTVVRGEIQDKLDLGMKNDILGLMNRVKDWKAYVMGDQVKKPRGSSWAITNLGVIDGGNSATKIKGETTEGWSIQRAEFALSASVTAALFTLSPIAAKGGDLCIDVTWQDSVIDDGVGDRLVADLEAWLGHIGS
ncbi:alcohol acetyltransferase-domain-containing protein [Ilyonectria robusta]|uniref:alcohol acetyltransferase-domain-containing protein n=1 Tax=Ilyonectria robusta TaxID=1079257 RepID=UPI001E8CF882|nr:alcohol acetyltransferase-domain-containing protein [Ilyonectria robusta]KAH8659002.1 alcohol acetyltransferase-domain-containing protein [Ilyonectria robusta]